MMIDPELAKLERFLDILSARNTVLASNIANADTPGYKARDMDFRSAMREALRLREEPPEGGAAPEEETRPPEVYETPALQPARDGNTVSPELEMVKLANNTGLYQVFAQAAAMRIALIKSALTSG